MSNGVQRWQYRTEFVDRLPYENEKQFQGDLQVSLDHRGQEGWELVSCTPVKLDDLNLVLIFKRPAQG